MHNDAGTHCHDRRNRQVEGSEHDDEHLPEGSEREDAGERSDRANGIAAERSWHEHRHDHQEQRERPPAGKVSSGVPVLQVSQPSWAGGPIRLSGDPASRIGGHGRATSSGVQLTIRSFAK